MSRAAGRSGGFRGAVGFLTVVGGAGVASPAALGWFPVVGAALGAVLGVVWRAAEHPWDPPVAAAIVVALDLALTGLLHVDGLVDSADGLLPPMDPQRRLDVMAAPETGAFGVAVGVTVILLRWTALLMLQPSIALLAGVWCASRTLMAAIALSQPYARAAGGGGLASAFLAGDSRRNPSAAAVVGAGGFVAAAVLLIVWQPRAGIAALGIGIAGAVAVVALARRRIGGFTGDVLGAAGMVTETLALIVASARW